MDVLGAIILEFLANTRGCKYQDTVWKSGSWEAPRSNGGATRLGSRRQIFICNSDLQRGKTDRTAWGSYTERAPPVLPGNTCVPGFEDELLLAAAKQQDELEDDDSDESDGDKEQSDSRTEGPDGGRRKRDKRLGDASIIPTRRARDSNRRPALTTFPILPTIRPYHVNSSFLFGSTTRPATTTLRRIAQVDENESPSSNNSTYLRMAPRTHLWISLWFLLTAPVIFWDAGYCFMRPRSFKGGDLHWIWQPYSLYQNVDLVYGVEAYNRGDGFANAQSFLNVIETILNLYYLYEQHIIASPAAPLIGVASAVMTLSKTVLYWAQEYFCGGCAIGHNDWNTLFWFWVVPNGLWLILPTLIISRLARDITSGLNTANKVAAVKKE